MNPPIPGNPSDALAVLEMLTSDKLVKLHLGHPVDLRSSKSAQLQRIEDRGRGGAKTNDHNSERWGRSKVSLSPTDARRNRRGDRAATGVQHRMALRPRSFR